MAQFRRGEQLKNFRGKRFSEASHLFITWPSPTTRELYTVLVKIENRAPRDGGIVVALDSGYKMPVRNPAACYFAVPT